MCLPILRRGAVFCGVIASLLVVLVRPIAAGENRRTDQWCFFFETEEIAPRFTTEKTPESEDDVAPPWRTLRSPKAEEVGATAGRGAAAHLPGLPLDTGFDSVAWIPEGPAPADHGDLNIAPDHPTAGCVTALAPHPTNENILYIGTVNGGVWRTDNALAVKPRWRPLTDDQISLSIGGLTLDPSDPSGNTLVAGFGRRSSFGLGGAQKGLIRSTDGGATWTPIGGNALDGRSVYNLSVRGNTMLVAVPCSLSFPYLPCTENGTLPGLYRTVDGGATFTNVSGLTGSGLPAGAATHLVADPSNSTRYYVHVENVGVYRTDNAGALWTNVSGGLGNATSAQVALAVNSSGNVFAARLAQVSTVYRSTDQGSTWVAMDSVQANTTARFNGFVADPSDPNVVYLSGVFTRQSPPFSGRVVRGNASLPANSQWTAIASTNGQGLGTAPHTDSRALAFDVGNRLIEGDDGGIYELPIANSGSQGTSSLWRSLNGNLQVMEMHSMAYDTGSRIFIGGAQDTGFQEQRVSGSAPWQTRQTGDGGDAIVDTLASPGFSVRYGSAQYLGAFFRDTYDAKNNLLTSVSPSHTLVGPGAALQGTFVTALEMNAVSGRRLIIGGEHGIYESADQGDTVTQPDSAYVFANELAKMGYGGRLNEINNPDVLFYSSGSAQRARTTAGGSFSTITVPSGGEFVRGLVFDPENWQTAYVLGETKVYLMTGGGGSFTDLTGNLTGVGTFHTVEYLTLPSGDAILVGADLGAYVMRLSAPGVWTTLGNNLPHAPVLTSSFDKDKQVLAISTLGRGAWLYDFKSTKTPSQYGETFQAFAAGASVFPSRTGELFSNVLAASLIRDDDLRELQLSDETTTSVFSAFRFPNLDPGLAKAAFSAKWNTLIYGNTSTLGEGFSFNFGPLGSATASTFTSGVYANQDGFGVGLTVSVRTSSVNAPGYYVRVNGTTVPGGFVSKPSSAWLNFNPQRHFFEVDWSYNTGLTLRVDGVAIFTNLPTPGFSSAADYRFVFGAATSTRKQLLALDNIAIVTGGVLVPMTGGAPYYASSEYAQNNQTADKAFDGDINTKWLGIDYTGFIGASLPTSRKIALYTLTSAEDVPERDMAAWDFQTSDDGIVWSQHGAQGAQLFANRHEPRAFVVANPTAQKKFRILMSANRGDPNIQLSEFQPWEIRQPFQVTTAADSGANSLRQQIAAAAAYGGAVITFDPSLSGQTLALSNEIVVSSNVTIDASDLATGITIDGGPGTNRIFTVSPGGNLTLTALTLTGGNGTGAPQNNGDGGAIFNRGTLTLDRCTVSGNNASTTSGRSGGAILNTGTLLLTQCTLAGNSCSGFGGALSNYGSATLQHSTLSGNSTATNGGGVDNGNGSTITLELENSIVAGNTGNDVNNFNGVVTLTGANIIPRYSSGFPPAGTGTNNPVDPLLAPLDNYGGVTRTMALQIGSPARNAATVLSPALTSDQRGFPILGAPDIGAYEAGTLANYNAYIWETLPVSATVAQHASTFDFDGDGVNNVNEFYADTNAANASSVFRLTGSARVGADFQVTFPTSANRNYTVEYSTDLVSWNLGAQIAGTGNSVTVAVGPVTAYGKFFLRARVEF